MEADMNAFINDEWRNALVAQWRVPPPDERGVANVQMRLRLYDPIELLDDVLQYVRAIQEYYQELTTDDAGNGSSPAGELRQAYEQLAEAHWFLIDEGEK